MLTKKAGIPLILIVLFGIAAVISAAIIGYAPIKEAAADSTLFGFIEPKGWVLYDDGATDRIDELWESSHTAFVHAGDSYRAIGDKYNSMERPLDQKKVSGVKTDAYFNPGGLWEFYVCVGDKNDEQLVDEGYCVMYNIEGPQVHRLTLYHHSGGQTEKVSQSVGGQDFPVAKWFTTSIKIEDGKYGVKVGDNTIFEGESEYEATPENTVYEVNLRRRPGEGVRIRNVYDFVG